MAILFQGLLSCGMEENQACSWPREKVPWVPWQLLGMGFIPPGRWGRCGKEVALGASLVQETGVCQAGGGEKLSWTQRWGFTDSLRQAKERAEVGKVRTSALSSLEAMEVVKRFKQGGFLL